MEKKRSIILKIKGAGMSSMIEHLPSMGNALGSIPTTKKREHFTGLFCCFVF
jgi:hypothetical protein